MLIPSHHDSLGGRFRPDVPHPARIYNYLLGGKDHFEADRATADEVARKAPAAVADARANRRFHGRVVHRLAALHGIRQFIDIGTGLPAPGNTHEVAQAAAPASRVVYVDNDPIVMTHARALLASGQAGRCDYVEADFSDTQAIIGGARRILDFAQPVALLLLALLHFIPDGDDPAGTVEALATALSFGSLVVISHLTGDLRPAAMSTAVHAYNANAAFPVYTRTKAEVTALFGGGLDLTPPGLVPVTSWHPANSQDRLPGAEANIYGGVALT
jgi:hypothetical protein